MKTNEKKKRREIIVWIAIFVILIWFTLSILRTGFVPIFVPHTAYLSSKLFPLSGWYSGLDYGPIYNFTFYPANASSNTSCIEYAVLNKKITTLILANLRENQEVVISESHL